MTLTDVWHVGILVLVFTAIAALAVLAGMDMVGAQADRKARDEAVAAECRTKGGVPTYTPGGWLKDCRFP